MSGVRLEVVEEESVERFAHEAMLGLADLEPEDLAPGNLTVPLGLSLWMRRGRIRVETARDAMLELRSALLRRVGSRRAHRARAPARGRPGGGHDQPGACTWTGCCNGPPG